MIDKWEDCYEDLIWTKEAYDLMDMSPVIHLNLTFPIFDVFNPMFGASLEKEANE